MSEEPGARRIVVVGASTAGLAAVEAIRAAGSTDPLTLIGDEPHLPYDRPPLSKSFLLGTTNAEKLTLRPASYFEEQRVELQIGQRAVALDTERRLVRLQNGASVAYDRLLIATGSEPRRLNVPGAGLPGVLTLRTLDQARALGHQLHAIAANGGRLVIVGGGFIGLEIASVARALGCAVTLLEALSVPLERAVGPRLGAIFARIHRAHGVDLRLETTVAAFHGRERVESVETAAGERIACALALVGVGVRPADNWLRGSGLRLEDGVWVDEYCATSVPGVYAAGDIARWPYQPAYADQPTWVRLEHFDTALRQGAGAGRNLLGERAPFRQIPYFWSEQYGMMAQYVGHAAAWDTEVSRGTPGEDPFLHFYLSGGRLVAALAVNRVRDLAPLKKLIGAEVTPEALAADDVDLRALARSLPQQSPG